MCFYFHSLKCNWWALAWNVKVFYSLGSCPIYRNPFQPFIKWLFSVQSSFFVEFLLLFPTSIELEVEYYFSLIKWAFGCTWAFATFGNIICVIYSKKNNWVIWIWNDWSHWFLWSCTSFTIKFWWRKKILK